MAKKAIRLAVLAFLLVASLLRANSHAPNASDLKKCQAVIIGETRWMAGDGDTAAFGVVRVTKLLRGSIKSANNFVSIYTDDFSIGDGGIILLEKDDRKVRSAWGRQQFNTESIPYTEANHYKVVGWLLATHDNLAMVEKLISN